MKYRDITSNAIDRFRLPPSHPYLAEVVLDPADWFRFEQMVGDTPATRIIGRDDPGMTAYVACASEEVRRRLQDGWG